MPIFVDDYKSLALKDTPMIDVRAPVEYEKGTILGAVNLPLMNDEERRLVGICYKEKGQNAAIALGHQLVSGDIKAQRIAAWCEYLDQNPKAHIFCFRGGLRSKTSQQWINATSRDIPLIKGGYKAFRQYLINATESIIDQSPLHIVSGQTGTGKTELLLALGDALDLEGLANHRGSSFGKTLVPQPSQINFENLVAQSLLRLQDRGQRCVILEDESRTIGCCALPQALRTKMLQSPVYLLEDSFDSRVERILQDYVIDMAHNYQQQYGEQGFQLFAQYLQTAFNGIRRRLGHERHRQLSDVLSGALDSQLSQNDLSGHIQWIEILLREYYDPQYQYQIEKKRERIVFQGDKTALLEILAEKQRSAALGL